MTWGNVAIAGASLVGGVMASKGASKGSKGQERAALAGIESEERMFEKGLELQAPYREAGYGALEGMQYMMSPEGRAESLSNYYGSEEYQGLRGQEEERALRTGAATGNIRGGRTQAALANIAPQLGQNYLSNQYNQFTGLANMGMGAASQGAQAAGNVGGRISSLQQQQGQAYAGGQMAQANIWGNVAGTLGGLAYNYANKPGSSTYADGSLI